MPGGKTRFSKEWLKTKDSNNCLLSQWCEGSRESIFKAYCRFCNKSINCDNQGVQQLLQHANGSLHRKFIKDILVKGNQLTISVIAEEPNRNIAAGSSASSVATTGTRLECVSAKDQATKAELIWALKVVASKFSYTSCDDMKATFQEMFPNAVPENFTMSSRKVSYLISEATGPYFNAAMTNDVNASSSFYTLEYDETTNKQVSKQLDILLRYWSNKFECVMTHHLRTFLMGHATAQMLADKLLLALEEGNLSLAKLLMLGADGPNVNKSVWVKINELVKEMEGRSTGLVNIGSCKLHVVHNCYGKGLECYGKNIADLVIDIYIWFKLSAARREDFRTCQVKFGLKEHKFLKHVECRWLTLLPAIKRLLEQWKAVLEYFLKYLPASQPQVCTNNIRYSRIKNHLQKQETVVQLHFLVSTGALFNNFLSLFQKDEPLIHLLHDHLSDLIVLLLSRFLKKDVIEDQRRTTLHQVDYRSAMNQLEDKSVDIGEEARKAMTALPKEKHPMIMLSVRSFYENVAKNMLQKLPISSSIVRDCRCLQPTARGEPWALEASKSLARKLPINFDVDAVGNEWRLYQLEHIPEEWYLEEVGGVAKHIRIDHYWRNVFKIKNCEGEPKYSNLMKLVKTTLVLSHGNADVERGFSECGRAVTAERQSLSEVSINSLRTTADGLKAFGNRPHLVPITKEFLSLGRSAHSQYAQRLEDERKKKEELMKALMEKEMEEKRKARQRESMFKSKQQITEQEERLAAKENSEKEEIDLGTTLVKEANEKLKVALKKKDLKSAAVAQAMLETGQQKVEHGAKKLEETRGEQKKIEKRRQAMITSFLQPPSKKR